jgi:hypothetical protein
MTEITFYNLKSFLKYLEIPCLEDFPDKDLPLRKRLPEAIEVHFNTYSLPNELTELIAKKYRKRGLAAVSIQDVVDLATIYLDEEIEFNVRLEPFDFNDPEESTITISQMDGPKTKVAEAGFIDIILTIDEMLGKGI